jgi:hypothetical protein
MGGGFFVPTLNPQQTVEEVFRSATEQHVFYVKHTVCIINGMLGVYFQRQRQSYPWQKQSAQL